jgi:toxin ParE1/3/4
VAYQVIIGRAAERDLINIGRYIARDNPVASEQFVLGLIHEAKSLANFPNRGGHYKDRPGTRFIVAGNYLVIYRVLEENKEVRILRFWHAARERLRWKKE